MPSLETNAMSKGTDIKVIIRRFGGDAVCCLVILAFCLMLGLPRYLINIDLGDEGFLAYGAERVIEGQIPNRDFFSLQPPLSFYTTAAMFKVFGTSLVTLRALGLCIYILIAILIYTVSRQFLGRIMSLGTALPATVIGMPFYEFVPLSVWQGVIAALAASVLILHAAKTSRGRWAFLAGVATALTILVRHDQGFYLTVAVLVYGLAVKFSSKSPIDKLSAGRMLGVWTAGITTVIVPLGVYWLVSGALPDMFKQLVVYPLTVYAKTSSVPMPSFDFNQPLQHNALMMLFYLPLVIGCLVIVWLFRCFFRRNFCIQEANVVFILAFSILFYCQVLARSDVYHLVTALGPFFVLCGWGLFTVSKAVGNAIGKRNPDNGQAVSVWIKNAVLIAGVAICVWFLLLTKPIFLSSPKQGIRTLLLKRGGVRVIAEEADSLENAVRTIQKHAGPEDSILCLPYQPMLYFLSGRRNPTRWNYLWPGDQSAEDHQELIRQAREGRPAVVSIIDGPEMKRYAPAIIEYVNAEYKASHKFGKMVLYLPSSQMK